MIYQGTVPAGSLERRRPGAHGRVDREFPKNDYPPNSSLGKQVDRVNASVHPACPGGKGQGFLGENHRKPPHPGQFDPVGSVLNFKMMNYLILKLIAILKISIKIVRCPFQDNPGHTRWMGCSF